MTVLPFKLNQKHIAQLFSHLILYPVNTGFFYFKFLQYITYQLYYKYEINKQGVLAMKQDWQCPKCQKGRIAITKVINVGKNRLTMHIKYKKCINCEGTGFRKIEKSA